MACCHAYTHAQKAALRAKKQQQPLLSQAALQNWFQTEYQQLIPISTLSDILSSQYNHLNKPSNTPQSSWPPDSKHCQLECWPDLERALIEWIQKAEGKIIISAEVIKEKARFFWKNIPQYAEKEMPPFSNGWLQGFQTRYNIKSYKQHGEAGSVAELAEQEIVAIQQAISAYSPQDQFNCDETALL